MSAPRPSQLRETTGTNETHLAPIICTPHETAKKDVLTRKPPGGVMAGIHNTICGNPGGNVQVGNLKLVNVGRQGGGTERNGS